MATTLITGATAGLGAAFAGACATRGDDLVLVARDAVRLETVASDLRTVHSVGVEVLPADLAQASDVARVVERLADPSAPIDLLVNNAGFGLQAKLTAPDISEHDRALEVMCRAVLLLGGAAGRAMSERGHGQIINVSSLSAWITQGNYSAVKSWVKLYSEGLANELHDSGVTVTALCPGWVRTEFHQRASIKTSSIPAWVWVDADRCVAEALADADAGKVISVPTRRWKLARLGLELLPRPAVRRLSRILSDSRD